MVGGLDRGRFGPPWEALGHVWPVIVDPQWAEMANSFMSIITECGLPRKRGVTMDEVALQQRESTSCSMGSQTQFWVRGRTLMGKPANFAEGLYFGS